MRRLQASDESSYVNGAIIVADGGITINGDLSKIDKDYKIAKITSMAQKVKSELNTAVADTCFSLTFP